MTYISLCDALEAFGESDGIAYFSLSHPSLSWPTPLHYSCYFCDTQTHIAWISRYLVLWMCWKGSRPHGKHPSSTPFPRSVSWSSHLSPMPFQLTRSIYWSMLKEINRHLGWRDKGNGPWWVQYSFQLHPIVLTSMLPAYSSCFSILPSLSCWILPWSFIGHL